MRVGALIKSGCVVATVVLGLALGCSSSGGGTVSCSAKGLCPNDTPPTASDITQCQGLVGDPKCGALFQSYYDCAYAQQKCASDGTLDGPTTEAAIEASCAHPIESYTACSGSTPTATSTSTAHTCGYDELPCCTSGAECASTGCCDPATNKCVGPGSACSSTNTICAASACEACGASGQPCCPTFGMTEPNACPAGGCCKYELGGSGTCVAQGDPCDAPDDGGALAICNAGSCSTCGVMSGPCCANATCTESGTLCVASTSTCMPCGGIGLPACQ